MIFLGNTEVKSIYSGQTEIQSVWNGNVQSWKKEEPTPTGTFTGDPEIGKTYYVVSDPIPA